MEKICYFHWTLQEKEPLHILKGDNSNKKCRNMISESNRKYTNDILGCIGMPSRLRKIMLCLWQVFGQSEVTLLK